MKRVTDVDCVRVIRYILLLLHRYFELINRRSCFDILRLIFLCLDGLMKTHHTSSSDNGRHGLHTGKASVFAMIRYKELYR